ncbi:glycine--tRNA ligase subunit beta [Kovacikia minuta CCNUW1]|uniref:glycine--tRNA ligase subunit beta n=1 Tax=Kovacikia minuta TaxID=2931930 RepID=UPI001CCE1B0B|nr:glycine--tRNA ligase subunit beta [Kovacikia minuta]UBF25769.1 glycine--tRNA ligase subunit beta [Kovacikia minuta CCNUW1]
MATFLLEVGTEELPADFIDEALEQWRSRIPQSLRDHYLNPEGVEFYGTPRRLAALVRGLPQRQPDQEEEIKGPPAQAAFKDGKPTKAAVGFAQKQGVDLASLEIRATEKGDFVFARRTVIGQPVAEILTQLVPGWITGLEGRRFMRWADGDLKFPRPIRWLVTLLDSEILPVSLVNGAQSCVSDRQSWGHRVLHPEPIQITHAEAYVRLLDNAAVLVDVEKRQTLIQQQIQEAAEQIGGVAVINPELLREVTNLVEFPTSVIGKFDAEFLELPPAVITTEMESHQRYFPVLAQADLTELLPYFITISNGDPEKAAIIATGNERVIRARLSDGKFFFDADRTHPLESYLPRLETVTFQADLGSVRAKVDRICQVAKQITTQLNVSDDKDIQRAALLCKADLVTQMVGEFPELQGVMGEKYARTSGESEAVATAIVEHYLPKGAGDKLPTTLPGQIVGLADRLDTLVSIFGLGMVPTGSSDPFALRRAATAIVNIIWAADLPLNLDQLIEQITADFAQNFAAVMKPSLEELRQQLQDFFWQRIRTLLQEDRRVDYDLVNAVLGENDQEYIERALKDLLDVRDRALFLQTIRNDRSLETIYETVNRSSRLATQGTLDTHSLDPTPLVRPALFQQPSEQAFYDALVQLVPQTQTAQAARNYRTLVNALAEIAPTVSNFFDGPQSVLVMDSDPDVRQNRLNLLGLLRNHARVLADFGAIVKSS